MSQSSPAEAVELCTGGKYAEPHSPWHLRDARGKAANRLPGLRAIAYKRQPAAESLTVAFAPLSDAGRCNVLARRASEVGHQQFSRESALEQFQTALRSGGATG